MALGFFETKQLNDAVRSIGGSGASPNERANILRSIMPAQISGQRGGRRPQPQAEPLMDAIQRRRAFGAIAEQERAGRMNQDYAMADKYARELRFQNAPAMTFGADGGSRGSDQARAAMMSSMFGAQQQAGLQAQELAQNKLYNDARVNAMNQEAETAEWARGPMGIIVAKLSAGQPLTPAENRLYRSSTESQSPPTEDGAAAQPQAAPAMSPDNFRNPTAQLESILNSGKTETTLSDMSAMTGLTPEQIGEYFDQNAMTAKERWDLENPSLWDSVKSGMFGTGQLEEAEIEKRLLAAKWKERLGMATNKDKFYDQPWWKPRHDSASKAVAFNLFGGRDSRSRKRAESYARDRAGN